MALLWLQAQLAVFDDIKKINEKLKNIEGVTSVNNQVTVKNK